MKVVLDIGAGNKTFARNLKRNNRDKELIIFCGEPDWNNPHVSLLPSRIVTRQEANELIEKRKQGIYKINSEYSSFDFDDFSLDMVTINSPHPLDSTSGLQEEVNRCLKPGGMFFYGHSMSFDLEMPKDFELIAKGNYPRDSFLNWLRNYKIDLSSKAERYPSELPNNFTPSPVIKGNMYELFKRKRNIHYENGEGSDYVYNLITLQPNYKVWIRKE